MPEPVVPQPDPLVDPLAILGADVLPAGFGPADLGRIPIPLDDRQRPVGLDRALEYLADASLRVDSRFDRVKREAEVAGELATFEAQGLVQNIQTLPAAAVAEKRRRIVEAQEARTREAMHDFQRWRAVAGRLLFEARAEAVQLPPHLANPNDHMGGIRDLIELDQAQRYLEGHTLAEAVERYMVESEATGNRRFLHLLELGQRPTRTDMRDAEAAVRLQRLIRMRQAARVPPELRTAFQRFELFAKGAVRSAKLELIAGGHVK